MVCKKSLYCLKNGPCATYQIRKQIWEENIRFRESLRNINQSDHYWSFQISNDSSDLDEPSLQKKRNKTVMKLKNCYDCASVTHEFSPELENKCKNCIYCKSNGNNTNQKNACLKEDTPETKALLSEGFARNPSKEVQTQSFKPVITRMGLSNNDNFSKINKNGSKYCHKYRNSLSSVQLLPNSKVKFPSQTTLVQPKKISELKKYPSMDVIAKDKNYVCRPQHESKAIAMKNTVVTNANKINDKVIDEPVTKYLNSIKLKNDILRNKEIKLPPWLSGTPLSRTTRKMLSKDKPIPFTSFGYNNINGNVGSKRTHNVYASTKEIFPNALSAKQQREEMILQSLKKEKQFRNSLFQDDPSRKMVNHSSLWAAEDKKHDTFKRQLHSIQKNPRRLANSKC